VNGSVQPALPFGGEAPATSPWCQRWRRQRQAWRHVAEDERFRPERYVVAPVEFAAAKRFVVEHHYARSYPADRLRFGLFDTEGAGTDGSGLVGVAVLSVPVHPGVVTGVFPGLVPYEEALELGRFVLVDECPANAESWFLSRVFRLARDAGVRGVVSFADPVPRQTADGEVLMPGHVGYAYQGSGAVYLGRSDRRRLVMLPDGTVVNARSMSKLRNAEPGGRGLERRLVALGAPVRSECCDPRVWLGDALSAVGARAITHRGVHRYAFVLGRRSERDRVEIAKPPQAFPRVHDGAWAA